MRPSMIKRKEEESVKLLSPKNLSSDKDDKSFEMQPSLSKIYKPKFQGTCHNQNIVKEESQMQQKVEIKEEPQCIDLTEDKVVIKEEVDDMQVVETNNHSINTFHIQKSKLPRIFFCTKV